MINCSQKAVFACVIGSTILHADQTGYELRNMPRGRICRLVETCAPQDGVHFTAVCCPITNVQRAMATAKQLGWMDEAVTLEQCAIEQVVA